MEKKKRRGVLYAGALAVVLAGIAGIWFFTSGIEVRMEEASVMTLEKTVKETGTVKSHSAVSVISKNGGEIKRVYVEEGDSVKVGQALVLCDGLAAQLDIQSLKAQAQGIAVQYKTAKELADKSAKLYSEGVLSYEEFNQAQTAADQLSAQLSSMRYSIKSYEETAGSGTIHAPVAGIVITVNAKQGETAGAGTVLFEIADLNQVYVKVDLVSSDADLVKVGQPVCLYNDDDLLLDGKALVEKVYVKAENIVSELGMSQKRVPVHIAMSKGTTLRLGTDVDVEIAVERKENVLAVSADAFFQLEGEDCLFVAENGKAVLRHVKTGLETEDYVEIVKGIQKGESVILSPDTKIQDGVRIKVQK